MTEEMIETINKLDISHYITYLYGSIFMIAILFTIYVVMAIVIGTITKKKQKEYLKTLTDEQQKMILKYKHINFFSTKKELK